MNNNTTKMAFPTTAPTSAQTITLLNLTGEASRTAHRINLTLRTSHDSGASGLAFEALLDGGTVYRLFVAYSHLAATAANACWLYDVAVPLGLNGLKIEYTNSANVLTSWEGAIAVEYVERGAP